MKAKTRKRLVISSIAMLLVAVLALGTATFAWFTQNTQATANGIYAKAVKSANLLLSKVPEPGDNDWGTSVDYALYTTETVEGEPVTVPARFYPVSSADGANWYITHAAESSDSSRGTNAITALTLENGLPAMNQVGTINYAFKSMLNVKNATDDGGVGINDVTITWSALPTYARIALVPANANGVALTTGDGVGFADNIYAQIQQVPDPEHEGEFITQTTYAALSGTDGTTTNITPRNAISVNIGSLGAGEAKYYLLYVWFEGQDPDCKDANVGQTISNLAFSVSGTPE